MVEAIRELWVAEGDLFMSEKSHVLFRFPTHIIRYGTVPFGLAAPVSPAGACAASPRGPVPDGLQLVDLVAEACAQARL